MVTIACTEKVPQQAEYYQQVYRSWSTACSPPQLKQVHFAGMAGMQGAPAGSALSHA